MNPLPMPRLTPHHPPAYQRSGSLLATVGSIMQYDTPLEQYISWGFVWDETKARQFSRNTIEAISDDHYETYAGKPTKEVLEEAVALTFAGSGLNSLVLPLSGGLDSRSIIAGFLANHDRSRVSCYTVGTDDDADVVAARGLCKRLGVDWERVDPVRDVIYDLDQIAARVRRVHEQTGTYALANSVAWRFPIDRISVERDALVLTGWPGRPVGSKLTRDVLTMGPREQLQAFFDRAVKGYAPALPYVANSSLSHVERFIRESRRELSPAATITDYEIIDFVFADHLRIKGGVTSTFTHGDSPFIHLHWLAHWYGRPAEDRIKRGRFREALASAYPHIFADLNRAPKTGSRGLLAPVRKKAAAIYRSWFRPAPRSTPTTGPENESLAAALAEAEASLRSRGLPELETLLMAGERIKAEGGKRVPRYATWAVSVEAHLRAGTLKQKQSVEDET